MHLRTHSLTLLKEFLMQPRGVHLVTQVSQVEWAMQSVYFGRPWADRYYCSFISSCQKMKMHMQLFPSFINIRSLRNFVDSPNCVDLESQVESYDVTSSQGDSRAIHLPSRILFGCHQRCSWMPIVGSLPPNSVGSPQWPASGASPVLATVPVLDGLYYSGDIDTRPQAVRTVLVQQGSFN
jgi:hypothetical protein